jgi:hypothetical protein
MKEETRHILVPGYSLFNELPLKPEEDSTAAKKDEE